MEEDAINLFKDVVAESRETREIVHRLAANVGADLAEDVVERKRIEKNVGDAFASVETEAIARASEDSALASQITTVETSLGNAISTAVSGLQTSIDIQGELITSQGQALIALETQVNEDIATAVTSLETSISSQGDQITAVSTLLNQVEVKANDATASGQTKWEVSSAPGGVLARYSLLGRVGVAGIYTTAGMIVDILPGSSRIVMQAGQFIITDGVNNADPFTFTGGVLTIKTMRAQTLISPRLESPDGQSYIDLSTQTIYLRGS